MVLTDEVILVLFFVFYEGSSSDSLCCSVVSVEELGALCIIC